MKFISAFCILLISLILNDFVYGKNVQEATSSTMTVNEKISFKEPSGSHAWIWSKNQRLYKVDLETNTARGQIPAQFDVILYKRFWYFFKRSIKVIEGVPSDTLISGIFVNWEIPYDKMDEGNYFIRLLDNGRTVSDSPTFKILKEQPKKIKEKDNIVEKIDFGYSADSFYVNLNRTLEANEKLIVKIKHVTSRSKNRRRGPLITSSKDLTFEFPDTSQTSTLTKKFSVKLKDFSLGTGAFIEAWLKRPFSKKLIMRSQFTNISRKKYQGNFWNRCIQKVKDSCINLQVLSAAANGMKIAYYGVKINEVMTSPPIAGLGFIGHVMGSII